MKNIRYIPNILTISRIVLTAIIPILLLQQSLQNLILSLILFIIASVTDFLDGYIARKYKIITTFGKIVDPIADKIMIITVFTLFGLLNWYSMIWLIPIVLREVFVTIYRFYKLKKGFTISADKLGKIKTTIQITTVIYIFLYHIIQQMTVNLSIEYLLQWVQYLLLSITVAITIYSGIEFAIKNIKLKKYDQTKK